MPTWMMFTLQDSATPIMEELSYFHDFTMTTLTMVTMFVAFNMISISTYKMTNRFLLQDQIIEMLWTIFPVIILIFIATPSLKLLYMFDDPFSPHLTVKTIGYQWYWSYEYSDFPEMQFYSYMISQKNLKLEEPRLLETDNSLVLPLNTKIRVITTAMDVIHSWTVPALGVKADAIPGRLNQMMFSIKRPGVFYGQCSEICGANHSFMPIKIEAVPMKIFMNWMLPVLSLYN